MLRSHKKLHRKRRSISCSLISLLICTLGHKAITKYRTKFNSIEEHDTHIFEQISKLTKRDQLFILGDFLFDCEKFEWYLSEVAKMPCTIKLVLGNHDSLKMYEQTIAKNIKIQLPLFSYKNMWISHCPIHPNELRSRILSVHGHLHGDIIEIDGNPDYRYFNVNLDNNYFKLVPFEEIVEYSKKLHP